MLKIITMIVTLIILLFFVFVVRLPIKEAKDERGYQILTGAGTIAFFAFAFIFVVIFLINSFVYSFTGAEYDLIFTLTFDVSLLTYGVMIMVLQKAY